MLKNQTMKTRTCPNCDHQYSRLEYFKTFINTIWTDVECRRCNQKMTIDLTRRIFVALAFGFWLILVNTTATYLDMNPMLWVLMISVFLIGSLFIFTFDTFKKVD